jgi:hypothetical protein
MTPVPTVAMDCGHLESRLDRLAASGRPAPISVSALPVEAMVRKPALAPVVRIRWFD